MLLKWRDTPGAPNRIHDDKGWSDRSKQVFYKPDTDRGLSARKCS